MPGKHYTKLGKAKVIRVPEKTVEWVKELVREIDTKEDVEDLMELLMRMAKNYKRF